MVSAIYRSAGELLNHHNPEMASANPQTSPQQQLKLLKAKTENFNAKHLPEVGFELRGRLIALRNLAETQPAPITSEDLIQTLDQFENRKPNQSNSLFHLRRVNPRRMHPIFKRQFLLFLDDQLKMLRNTTSNSIISIYQPTIVLRDDDASAPTIGD